MILHFFSRGFPRISIITPAKHPNSKVFMFFWSKNMDLHVLGVEKHGSARFSGRKTWIHAFSGSKNMDPRVFRVEQFESARFRGCSGVIPVGFGRFGAGSALVRIRHGASTNPARCAGRPSGGSRLLFPLEEPSSETLLGNM